MWEYIVLGQVPGTQIQVTFTLWLLFITGLGSCLGALYAVHYLRSSKLLLALRINHVLQTAAYTQWLVTRRHIQA